MHETSYRKGTDARNHVATCKCGWAASGTWKDVRSRGAFHLAQDNPLSWFDRGREFQSDKRYPAYAGWKMGVEQ